MSETQKYPSESPPIYTEHAYPNPGPVRNHPPGIPLHVTEVHTTSFVGPTIIVSPPMGSYPAATVCRSCGTNITTRVERSASMRTHLIAVVMCLVGCCLCAFIPYCVDSCKKAEHYCPNCNAYIGSNR